MYEYISSSQNIGRRGFWKKGYFTIKKTKLGVIGEVNNGDKKYSIVKKTTSSNEATFTGDFTAASRKRFFFQAFFTI